MYNLENYLNDFISRTGNCQYGITFARALKKRLFERFPSLGMDMFEKSVANYLDPRYMGLHLAEYGTLESIKIRMESKWGSDSEETQSQPVALNLDLSPTSRLLQRSRLSRLDTGASKIRKEMAIYESYSFASKASDVLGWWRLHEEHLPILAQIARRILAIPASSAKSERVFSTGGLIVSTKRGSLGPKKVEELIVIKQNMSKVKLFLATSKYKIGVGSKNAFESIIVHKTAGEVLEEPVEDMYDLENEDDSEPEDEIMDILD